MAVSAALGARRIVELPAGPIEYRERGTGRPIVFVHGVGVNADLWRHVVPALADGFRCIAPDLPWGAHRRAIRPGADLSLPGMARIVADLVAALDLDDVTLVGNDTGGAVAQVLAGRHPERIGRLVLTSCDAFDRFPPPWQRYLLVCARSRALIWLVAQATRVRAIQRLPTAYGLATRTAPPPEIMRSYTEPVRTSAGVRRDLARLLRAVDPRDTLAAAQRLRHFDRPALVLWAAEDRIFPIDHGRRLAQLLPQGRFETIAGSRTFIPEDRPDELGRRIRAFAGGESAGAGSTRA